MQALVAPLAAALGLSSSTLMGAIGLGAMGISAASATSDAVNQSKQAAAQAAAASAQLKQQNRMLGLKREYELKDAAERSKAVQENNAMRVGQLSAMLAASGFDINSGTPAVMIEAQKKVGVRNSLAEQESGTRAAWTLDQQERNNRLMWLYEDELAEYYRKMAWPMGILSGMRSMVPFLGAVDTSGWDKPAGTSTTSYLETGNGSRGSFFA